MNSTRGRYWVGCFTNTEAIILIDRTVVNESRETFLAYSLNYDCMREFSNDYRSRIREVTDRSTIQRAIARYEGWITTKEGRTFHGENSRRLQNCSDQIQQFFDERGITSRRDQIQQFSEERGITTLLHFTRVQNLGGILQRGLLGRSLLEGLPPSQRPVYNDQQRIDGCPEAVCLSISFPNYRMFYKYSHTNRAEWLEVQGRTMSVECAYQGSKVFEKGGPYHDLYSVSSREAKTDERLRHSGELVAFNFLGEAFPIHPTTAFYDWLYITALWQNRNLAQKLVTFRGFSDIAFNPKHSLNCQARSAALFVSLYQKGWIEQAVQEKEDYLRLMNDGTPQIPSNEPTAHQLTFFP